jgi:hypothetical protein
MGESMTEKKVESKPAKTAVTRRLIACTQSTGRVGKSTVAEGFISWLRYADIKFAAIDGDSEHQTLRRRYPDKVDAYDATESLDHFSRMIRALPPTPVILIDLPAQATTFLLQASARVQLLDFFSSVGIRPTLLIFAADDPTAKESAAKTVRYFGDRADYLLIENPAKFRSDGFHATKFAAWFAERNTPILRIPAIQFDALAEWEALERKYNKYLSLDEAAKHPEMHDLFRIELDFVRNTFLAQCEDYASHLLPDVGLVKNKVLRHAEQTTVPVNHLKDEFFA